MRKKTNILTLLILTMLLFNCSDDTFKEDSTTPISIVPKNLVYPNININDAREFFRIRSGLPTVETGGLDPTFELISIKDGNGNILDSNYTDLVTISQITIVDDKKNSSEAGRISIATNNLFSPGKYVFAIRVSVNNGTEVKSTDFNEGLVLNIGPQLVDFLLYSPVAQNLVIDSGKGTTQPFIKTGNPDVTFSLGSDEDKLTIDSATGIISLKSGFRPQVNDTIIPKVILTSNISQETTEFQGNRFLYLVASTTPITLPKQTIYFFYPSLAGLGSAFGYVRNIITPGKVTENNTWRSLSRTPLANDERPEDITDNKRLETNIVIGGGSEPHVSEIILNSQNLTLYDQGYSVSAVFYTMNRYVEYMQDGRTPTDLEIYYATDYDGTNNDSANWIQINDQIECLVNKITGTTVTGTPYPGDQKGDDPDGLKNTSYNADGRWVRNEFSLMPLLDQRNFTLKFKMNSYFTGVIKTSNNTGRGGRYLISDVYYKATEQ